VILEAKKGRRMGEAKEYVASITFGVLRFCRIAAAIMAAFLRRAIKRNTSSVQFPRVSSLEKSE
jgi:hypothetical protein